MRVELTMEEAAWMEMAANIIAESNSEAPAKAGKSAARKLAGALERAGARKHKTPTGSEWAIPRMA